MSLSCFDVSLESLLCQVFSFPFVQNGKVNWCANSGFDEGEEEKDGWRNRKLSVIKLVVYAHLVVSAHIEQVLVHVAHRY